MAVLKRLSLAVAGGLGAVALVAGCSAADSGSGSSLPTRAVVTGIARDEPVATATTAAAVDHTHLPLGDGKVGTTAKRGYIMQCPAGGGAGGGAFRDGPWIRGDGTWDSTAKAVVDGAVAWPSAAFALTSSAATRQVSGNGLPTTHTTGVYPVASSDDAYQYDRNPNRIAAQTLSYALAAQPVLAAQPSCLPGGPIGVMLSGVVFFNGLDDLSRDAVAHEIQDACEGHPQQQGQYHYHDVSKCLPDAGTGHSAMVGYAFDGFGIFGLRGEDGRELTDAGLDECHGHTHEIDWDGKRVSMYHYHATAEYPYTLGCFRGTAIRVAPPGR
jgi:hypothetical protein